MKRFVIGITGGIATGKTAVLQELAHRGVPTISSDDLAHHCLRPGHPVYRRVVRRYGRKIQRSYGGICRADLGKIVFAQPAERKWLERQIHPWVIHQLKLFIRKHHGLIALDIPLLFEARLEKLVDAVVVVGSTRRAQLTRIKRRDGLPPADALLRIRAQMPLSDKRRRADYVIENAGSRAELKKQVQTLLESLSSKIP